MIKSTNYETDIGDYTYRSSLALGATEDGENYINKPLHKKDFPRINVHT